MLWTVAIALRFNFYFKHLSFSAAVMGLFIKSQHDFKNLLSHAGYVNVEMYRSPSY